MENTETKVPPIIKELANANTRKKIKIRARKLKDGYSVYLDIFTDNKHQYDYLNIILYGKSTTRENDKNNLKIAIEIRDEKERTLIEERAGFSLRAKEKVNFIDYMTKMTINYNWTNAIRYMKMFAGNKFTFDDITKSFCSDYREFLLKQEKLSQNTSGTYFSLFKAAINKAVREDVITKSPALGLIIKKVDTKREFLTEEELVMLASTPKPNNDICNGFLFSCFTGLRMSDIKKLTFSDIQGGYLCFQQQKTGGVERIKLAPDALSILEEQSKCVRSEFVFMLIDKSHVEKKLKIWTKAAGIDKHITFHCSRHTFATLCLTLGVDLYTVSKLLGHRDLKTTQIYTKVIDKVKDDAINKLPSIFGGKKDE